jgi:site-specific DNA-methyltransferase (adenine-specific)
MELNKIYCENCLDTMSRMPDNFIDLTVTSPPYDNLRNYNGYSFDFEAISLELFRVTKVGGVVVWVVGDATIDGSETGTSFIQALQFKNVCGFRLHDTMIFERQARFPDDKRYYPCFEYMFVFSKMAPKTFNPITDKRNNQRGDKLASSTERNKDGSMRPMSGAIKHKSVKDFGVRGNIWRYDSGYQLSTPDELAFDHPAIFPEKLARDHIYSWSNEGDLIYDPFMGSGTTAKMAHLQKRNWIGSEISQEYVDLANKRIDPYLKQLTIF